MITCNDQMYNNHIHIDHTNSELLVMHAGPEPVKVYMWAALSPPVGSCSVARSMDNSIISNYASAAAVQCKACFRAISMYMQAGSL